MKKLLIAALLSGITTCVNAFDVPGCVPNCYSTTWKNSSQLPMNYSYNVSMSMSGNNSMCDYPQQGSGTIPPGASVQVCALPAEITANIPNSSASTQLDEYTYYELPIQIDVICTGSSVADAECYLSYPSQEKSDEFMKQVADF